jgi:hypothetical protein
VGLFAVGKRKGLFSGEEIVKRQSTLNTNLRSIGISVDDKVDGSET